MANRLEIAADVIINGANQIPVVSNDLEKLNQAGQNAGNALGGKTTAGKPGLTAGANQAGMALTNLNRVVQDAPFGLLGIANNIDPLLQSLTALGNQAAPAGATGLTKFKAAGSALLSTFMGPQGILFAISAATSLMLVFGKDLFKVEEQADETGEALAKMARMITREFETMSGAISDAKQEMSLIGVGDDAKSQDRIKRISDALQKLGQEQQNIANAKLFVPGIPGSTERAVSVAALDEQLRKNAELIKSFQDQKDLIEAQIEARKRIIGLIGEETNLPAKKKELEKTEKTQKQTDEDYFREVEKLQRIQLATINGLDDADAEREKRAQKEVDLAEKTAKEKLKWAEWEAEEKARLEDSIMMYAVSAVQNTADSIQIINEAFLGNRRGIAVAAILIQKAAAIADIITNGIVNSNLAAGKASANAANPLGALYATQAVAIRVASAAAVAAVGATAAAQIAALYSGGSGNSGTSVAAGGAGSTITAGYTGFSASANPAAAQQERRGTAPAAPTGQTTQKLIIADGFGNMVAKGQLEIAANPNIAQVF